MFYLGNYFWSPEKKEAKKTNKQYGAALGCSPQFLSISKLNSQFHDRVTRVHQGKMYQYVLVGKQYQFVRKRGH